MKMRKLKRLKMLQMAWVVEMNHWAREIDRALELTPEEKAASFALNEARWKQVMNDMNLQMATVVEQKPQSLGDLLLAKIQQDEAKPKRTYSVYKVSTGELMGQYQDLPAAEDVVMKAQRNKKAKLEVRST